MNEEIKCQNFMEKGNPAGGTVKGTGIEIEWMSRPKVPNVRSSGASLEGVILACISRLQFFQDSKFSCRQNALAITHLEEALHWLYDRTRERTARGVEGTYEL